jgi:hypothetical protein
MGQNASYSGQASDLRASLSIGLELLAYKLNPERLDTFSQFFDTTIKEWLEKYNIASANAWIIEGYLVVLSPNKMPPWSGPGGIPGLEHYLAVPQPLPIHGLKAFTLSPRAAVVEYPAGKSA